MFMIEDSLGSSSPLNDKRFPFSRSLGSCMLELFEDSQPIRLVVPNMDLVRVVLNDFFLSFEIIEDTTESTVEILPQ
jgi:hypothetical protein